MSPTKQGADYFRMIFYDTPVVYKQISSHKSFKVFDELFGDRLTAIQNDIKADLEPDGILLRPAVLLALGKSLQARLKRLLQPVLLACYEDSVEQAVVRGELSAERTTAQELKFRRQFIRTMRKEGTRSLFAESSYLEHMTRQIIYDWRVDTRTFLLRLARDWDVIFRTAGWPLKPTSKILQKIRCDVSDMHDGGQTAKIIEVSAGKFVYKPRSLGSETGFYTLLRQFNREGLDPPIYTPWVLQKNTYGWMEYCQPLSNLKQGPSIDQNARQFGLLSAVWYMLGGTDLHRDNILFTKKGVVIVDSETIFEADLHYASDRTNQQKQIEQAPDSHTILSTHAFATYLSSPVSKRGKRKDIAGVARYKELLERTAPSEPFISETFVRVASKTLGETLGYFKHIPTGSLIKTLQQHFSGRTSCRVILRPTRTYTVLRHNLIHSFSPLGGRSRAAAYLREQLGLVPAGEHRSLVDYTVIEHAEVAQLMRLDIPYVARTLGKNQLRLAPGSKTIDLPNIDFISVRQRLWWLQRPQFISEQVRLVRQALTPPLQHSHPTSFTRQFSDKTEVRASRAAIEP